MYLAVEFDIYDAAFSALEGEAWTELVSVVPGLPAEKPKWGPNGTFIITDAAIPILAKHSVNFKLSKDDTANALGSMLVKLQDRISSLEMTDKSVAELANKQCAVQITIPDFALLYIDEVTWLENCCTERLQEALEDGWRILAVCPPNSARRPDYILGRRKKLGFNRGD